MRTTRWDRAVTQYLRVLAWILIALPSASCVTTHLYAHHTLEGAYFPASRVGDVRRGMTETEVKAVLGNPLEVLSEDQGVVWRYFERAQPQWCDGGKPSQRPEYVVDARVSFKDGTVTDTSVTKRGSSFDALPMPE
jgi:outer membrane protein assembly factor BamE (lipoprotein component of BamABCDE complex)